MSEYKPIDECTKRRDAPLLVGRVFGLLYVESRGQNATGSIHRWWCRCECGTRKLIRGSSLTSGVIVSCGCYGKEQRRKAVVKHGESADPTHKAWRAMISRCDDPTTHNYANYGGRGISVCARWRESFENFISDMGRRPSSTHSIDRIENDGNYEPGNCRWATANQQARNRRSTHHVEAFGERLPLVAWAERAGMKYTTLKRRLDNGMNPEEAILKSVEPRKERVR